MKGLLPATATDSCLCACVAVTPPDEPVRPEEDTFGVSFLLNDVDETAAKVGSLQSADVCSNASANYFLFVKYPSQGCLLALTRSAAFQRLQHSKQCWSRSSVFGL